MEYNRYNERKEKKESHSQILRKLFRGKFPIVIFFIVIILFFLLLKYKSIILFIVIAIIAGVINYFLHVSEIHLHLGHISFLAVIFSYALDFKYGVFMIIIGHFIPEIVAGHADTEMLITGFVYTLVSFIASIMKGTGIVGLGIGLTLVQAILTITLGKLAGTPISELISEDGLEFLMNFIYYVSFSQILLKVIL